MDIVKEQFLELLRAGLWGHEADTSLFADKDTDWDAILETAKAQTVIAIVFDGMETLPSELRPQRKLFLEWYSLVLQIERTNELMDNVITEVFGTLSNNGINPILMKGHGMAANYLKPDHRQCGDIDIFTGTTDHERADETFKELGAAEERSSSEKHSIFEISGIHVENHIHTQIFENPVLDRRYKILEKEYLCSDYHNDIDIKGYKVAIPPVEFNIVFTLAHIVRHLMTSGIGIRQLCDLTMLMHESQGADRNVIKEMIVKLKFTRIAAATGGLAVKYLGLPHNELLFGMEKRDDSRKILDEILSTGNFGYYDSRRGVPKQKFLSRKLQSGVHYFKKVSRLGRYFPAQLFWGPFTIIKNNLIEIGKK